MSTDQTKEPPPPTSQGDGTPGPDPHSPADPSLQGAAPPKAGGRPPTHVQMHWDGDRRFDVARPGGPSARVDVSGATGPGPVDTLLGSLASCVSVDVLEILAKRRTPVASLDVDVVGARADDVPARVTSIDLTFRITGEGIDRPHAERAIELAITKYCSVRDSLDPDMPVRFTLELNGRTDD